MNKAKLDIQQFAPEPPSPNRYYLSLTGLDYLINEKIKPDMALREVASNKVTTINSSSTDTQYPSAKCVYDLVGNIESLLETLDVGSGV